MYFALGFRLVYTFIYTTYFYLYNMFHVGVMLCVCRSLTRRSIAGYADVGEQTDVDETCSLQFAQWTVPQFCFHVLEKLIPCFCGPVDELLMLRGLELLHRILILLNESLLASALWEDSSLPAQELVRLIYCASGEIMLAFLSSCLFRF